MLKLGDIFGAEAYYDNLKNNNEIIFIFEEQNEEFIYDLNNSYLKEGEEESFTWEIISAWLEEYEEQIKEMIKNDDLHYIVDLDY